MIVKQDIVEAKKWFLGLYKHAQSGEHSGSISAPRKEKGGKKGFGQREITNITFACIR